MKKFILMVVIFMGMFVTNASAQLKEVRGVQTRSVSYVDEDGEERRGYEFKNENSYDVWLEMSMVSSGYVYITKDCLACSEYQVTVEAGSIMDKKSITLKAGETYVWKCDIYPKYISRYYVEYKAYKAE